MFDVRGCLPTMHEMSTVKFSQLNLGFWCQNHVFALRTIRFLFTVRHFAFSKQYNWLRFRSQVKEWRGVCWFASDRKSSLSSCCVPLTKCQRNLSSKYRDRSHSLHDLCCFKRQWTNSRNLVNPCVMHFVEVVALEGYSNKKIDKSNVFYKRGVQIPGAGSLWRLNVLFVPSYLSVFSMELPSCNLFDAQNLRWLLYFFENMCTPVV